MSKLLILSDLHAHAELLNDAAPSYISIRDDSQDPTTNSLSGLKDFLLAKQITADWVLCPGDIAHQANPLAHAYAWKKLDEIKNIVGAKELIATVGNHDIDSRRSINEFDPKTALQTLTPPFPGFNELETFQYWAENFFIKIDKDTDITFLVINSCAFHGLASRSADGKAFIVEEFLYGRISGPTLTRIRSRLRSLPSTKFNIVLVHHHVSPHPLLKNDVSLMKGNAELLDALKASKRRWLVVHGHLHLTALRYSDADHYAPVVFSAASVGSVPYPVKSEITPRNQFYLVELHDPPVTAGAQMRGRVLSWDWAPTRGWVPSRAASGLPHLSGFGARPDIVTLAQTIADTVRTSEQQQMHWASLSAAVPDLQFLLARDCADLIDLCESSHGVSALQDSTTGNIQIMSMRVV